MYMWLWIECRFAACWKWKQAFTLRTSWQHFHRSFLITIRVCKRAVFTFLHKNAIPLAHAELTGTLKNNKPYVDVVLLAPAQGLFYHSGFWSQAMSPLITWPPSSALRRLQIRNFVFWSLCDLAATNPTLLTKSSVTFQFSNIQQYICSLCFAKGSKATWEKLLVHPAGSRPFDLLPKFWKLLYC